MPYDNVAVLKVQFREDSDPETQYWLRVYRNSEPYEWQAIESRDAVDGLLTGMMLTSRKDLDKEEEDKILRIAIRHLPLQWRVAWGSRS